MSRHARSRELVATEQLACDPSDGHLPQLLGRSLLNGPTTSRLLYTVLACVSTGRNRVAATGDAKPKALEFEDDSEDPMRPVRFIRLDSGDTLGAPSLDTFLSSTQGVLAAQTGSSGGGQLA